MKRNEFLSIVMPAYNEGENIHDNLFRVADIVENLVADYEIICVDDGSTDNTAQQVKSASEQNERIKFYRVSPNRGKGHALRIGASKAVGNLIMYLDSDLDLSPAGIADFLQIMEEQNADVVIGSKLHPDSIIYYPFIRRIISFGYYLLIKILFHLNVRDTQTGMKLFKSDIIKKINKKVQVNNFAFDIELLSVINRMGYKIVDAPIVLEYGRTVRWGRINIKTITEILIDTLKIFYRLNIINYYD